MSEQPKFAPGIHSGIPMFLYRRAKGVANSDLKHLHPTPSHYKSYKEQPKAKETESQILGTVFHSLTLEPDQELPVYVIPDGMDFRTNAGKVWRADHHDKPCIHSEDLATAKAMREAVMAYAPAERLLRGGAAEQCLFGLHGETSLLRKARLDKLTEEDDCPMIVDLKSIRDIARFEKDAFEFRYHVQMAYYMDLLQDIVLSDKVIFWFVVVESSPPFCVRVVKFDDASLRLGRETYQADLALLAECESLGCFPGYPEQREVISLPKYAFPIQDRNVIAS